MECNLMGSYKIMCFADAERVVEALKGKQVDLFIVNFLSWHITPYVMHLLKNYRDTPLLIWGIGGTTDSTGKLHSPAAAAGITGIVLTKLDGTAKGGVVVAIKQELGIPVKLVGVGEGIDDLMPFDPKEFAAGIL